LKTFFSLLFQVLIYGGIIQSVFIVLLLNNKGVRKGRANIFLSVLLLALAPFAWAADNELTDQEKTDRAQERQGGEFVGGQETDQDNGRETNGDGDNKRGFI